MPVELQTHNLQVAGSNPALPSPFGERPVAQPGQSRNVSPPLVAGAKPEAGRMPAGLHTFHVSHVSQTLVVLTRQKPSANAEGTTCRLDDKAAEVRILALTSEGRPISSILVAGGYLTTQTQ